MNVQQSETIYAACLLYQSCVQIIKLVKQIKSCVHSTKIKSATGPVKSQIFLKRFVNRLQINVTINYTSYLFFIFEGIL